MFEDRYQAGELLAGKLSAYQKKDVVVLAIPRGGVPVAKAVSKKLEAQLGIVVTKKIGAPEQEELAIGAVGPEGEIVLDQNLIHRMGIGEEALKNAIKKAQAKVKKYKSKFRLAQVSKDRIKLRDKIIILVDDGIATGATIKAAIQYIKKKGTAKIILAVPVAPREALAEFRNLVDRIVVLSTPPLFQSVGQFYKSFPQVTDEEVLQLLQNK